MHHVAFDSPIEEMVDVQLRLANHGTVYPRQRSQAQWWVGLVVTIGACLNGIGKFDQLTPVAVAVILIVSGAVGALGGMRTAATTIGTCAGTFGER